MTINSIVLFFLFFVSACAFAQNGPRKITDPKKAPKIDTLNLQKTEHTPRRAFFSFLEDTKNGFIKGSMALGYSIRKNSGYFRSEHQPSMILMSLTDFKNDPNSRRALERIGWTIIHVTPISPFKKGFLPQFKNQFTKAHIWEMTEWDSILYIDSDAVVKGSLSGIFEAIESDARYKLFVVKDAVDDIPFNAGIMGIRPDASLFQDMLKVASKGNYNPIYGDQGFLNVYFKGKYVSMPSIYNLSVFLDRTKNYPSIWQHTWDDAKIVHYTVKKPWDTRNPADRETLAEKDALNYWWKVFDESQKSLQLLA